MGVSHARAIQALQTAGGWTLQSLAPSERSEATSAWLRAARHAAYKRGEACWIESVDRIDVWTAETPAGVIEKPVVICIAYRAGQPVRQVCGGRWRSYPELSNQAVVELAHRWSPAGRAAEALRVAQVDADYERATAEAQAEEQAAQARHEAQMAELGKRLVSLGFERDLITESPYQYGRVTVELDVLLAVLRRAAQ
mgnify:CR=1 FL=1